MTGHVVVNGLYIPPPYVVTSTRDSAFVNGVCIWPSHELPPRPVDSARRAAVAGSEGYRGWNHLRHVADGCRRQYVELLRQSRDTAAAISMVMRVAREDTLVTSVYPMQTPYHIMLVGPKQEMRTSRDSARYDFWLPHERLQPPPGRDVAGGKSQADRLRTSLLRGRVRVYFGVGFGSVGRQTLVLTAATLLDPTLSRETRWTRLLRPWGPSVAYYLVANLESSRHAWMEFARLAGEGK
jgi:hypothetical protein